MPGETPLVDRDTKVEAPIQRIHSNLGALMGNLQEAKGMGVSGADVLLFRLDEAKKEFPHLFPAEIGVSESIPSVSTNEIKSAAVLAAEELGQQTDPASVNRVITTDKGNSLSEKDQEVVAICRREHARVEKEVTRVFTECKQKYQKELDPLDENSREYRDIMQRVYRDAVAENPKLFAVFGRVESVEPSIIRLTDDLSELPNLNGLLYEHGEIQRNGIQNLDQAIRLHELSGLIKQYPWQRRSVESTREGLVETITWLRDEAPEYNLGFDPMMWPETQSLSREDEIKARLSFSRTVLVDSPLLPALEHIGSRVDTKYESLEKDLDSEDKTLGRRYNSVVQELDGIWEKLSGEVTPEKKVGLEEELGKAFVEVLSIDNDYRKKYEWGDILILEYMDSGATAFAHRAVVRGGIKGLRGESKESQDVQAVVKIARGGHWNRMVEGEAGHLEALRAKQRELFPTSPSHFPDSALTKSPDGRLAVVMEFITARNLFRLEIGPDQWLDTLNQACETIAIAHAVGIFNPDRAKYDDMRYFPETGRFVMLDWTSIETHSGGRELPEVINAFLEVDDARIREKKQGIFTPDIRNKLNVLKESLYSKGKIDATISMKVTQLVKRIDSASEQDIKAAVNL